MITIFTTPSCGSCRKAKQWLKDFNIDFEEKNLLSRRITNEDINMMLKNADNGFDDIISRRSKVFIENNLDVDSMSVAELKKFIIANPSVLKRPIIVDDNKMQVGYNDEDIRIFIPQKMREIIMCSNCLGGADCDYQVAVKQYLADIKEELEVKQMA